MGMGPGVGSLSVMFLMIIGGNIMEEADDFVILRKSRRQSQKKVNIRFEDSEDSGDDFVPPPSKKNQTSDDKIVKSCVARDKRNEKGFDEEQSFSKGTSEELESCNDSSDIGNYHQSASDEDFEPSPPTKKNRGHRCPRSDRTRGEKDTDEIKPKPVQTSPKPLPVDAILKESAALTARVEALPILKGSTHTTRIKTLSVDPSIPEKSKRTSGIKATDAGLGCINGTRKTGSRLKWVPPANVGYNDSKTPVTRSGIPTIRVGLSRKAQVKPLHQIPVQNKLL